MRSFKSLPYYGWGIFLGLFPGAPNRSLEKVAPKCLQFIGSVLFCWWKCLKGEEIGIIQMSNITFGTLPPSLTTQLRTNQKTSFFWEGMLPPVTWKMPENFVAKSCAGTKLWSSTAASAGESWKTGVYFKSDWRQFEDQADGFFFRKRLKLVSK